MPVPSSRSKELADLDTSGFSTQGGWDGKYGFDSLTHAKSVLISLPDVEIDHLFPPYTKEKVQALNQWFEY